MTEVSRPKVAFITGITGQDGSYLAELLLAKGYQVHGMVRPASTNNRTKIQHLYPNQGEDSRLKLHFGDMTEFSDIHRIISTVKPAEIYNLAGQTHIDLSFGNPEDTANANALGTLRLLEAIKKCGLGETVRFFQASSCDMFSGGQKISSDPISLSENTAFHPSSPYGISKVFGYWIVRNYREAYNMFLCNGILFNHESPRRGENFVTRKTTRCVAKIALGQMEFFELGNLNARRDWGHAKDYVLAMWMLLQHEKPDDFVIASGEAHSVRELVEAAFLCVNKTIRWEGEGVEEVGIEEGTDIVRVKVNPKFYRPIEGAVLTGNPSKAEKELGWKSTIKFSDLVRDMVESDLEQMKKNPS